MSKMVTGKCKKCGGFVQFDIGNMSREEAEASLKSYDSFECIAGNHMELTSPYEMYDFDWDHITENEPVTEESFYNKLKSSFKEVYSSDEFGDYYTVDSFMYGKCLCHPRNGDSDDMIVFDFVTSPKGKRYYIAML